MADEQIESPQATVIKPKFKGGVLSEERRRKHQREDMEEHIGEQNRDWEMQKGMKPGTLEEQKRERNKFKNPFPPVAAPKEPQAK